MDYENLLEKAYKKMPKKEEYIDRFEIPNAETMIQGNQTIIKNFSQICEKIRRNPKHLLKFLTKELATPAGFDDTRATFQSKITQGLMQKKLELYIKDYVFCKECKRPDTKLIKKDRITYMKCEACGAEASVRQIK